VDGTSILVVDDNRDLADGLVVMLRGEGYFAEAAYCANAALECLHNEVFDCILLDVDLPDAHGLETVSELAEINRDTHILLMTGYRIIQLLKLASVNSSISILPRVKASATVVRTLKELTRGVFLIGQAPDDLVEELKQQLTLENQHLVLVKNKTEALTAAKNESFDFLVLDFHLPLVHSLMALYQLRKFGYRGTVVILGSNAGLSITENGNLYSLPATGCLFKPFDEMVLLDHLEHIGQNDVATI